MGKTKTSISDIPTLDASNLAYEFEKSRIKGVTDENILEGAQINKSIPSNLVYLDDTYDKSTGTSATAFQDKNTGEIIIAYTGTNRDSDAMNDIWRADLLGIFALSGKHYPPAFEFYEKIEAKYGSNITLTGHSLGGNVAQRVALKYNVQNTVVYNAAPLYLNDTVAFGDKLFDYITPGDSVREKIINDRKNFTGQVTRIRTEEDPLNFVANLFLGVYLGEEYILKNSGGHSIDPYITGDANQIDQINNILSTESVEKMTDFEKKNLDILLSARMSMQTIADIKESITTNGRLSDNGMFYLDSLQANAIAAAITETVTAGYDEIKANSEKAVDEAEELFNQTKEIPWFVSELSVDEVQAAYEEAGVTYDSIVTKTQTHFDETVAKMSNLVTVFTDLQGQIQSSVEQAIAADESLAGDINQWISST